MTQPNPSARRGSRKHVLDWVESPGFLQELEALVAPAPVRIAADAPYMPLSYRQPTEARLDGFGRRAFGEHAVWDELPGWWLRNPKGANTPNWDLAVVCEIDGQRGMLLVEAKANVPELSDAGKKQGGRKGVERSEESRVSSAGNAEQIAAAIDSARLGLLPHVPGIAITAGASYQLSNRLAFSWKLAERGIPVVLLYLGFTGDGGLRKAFKDEAHWKAVFQDHVGRVSPAGITEAAIPVGAASMWVLSRARKVLSASPQPESRSAVTTAET